MPKEKNLFRVRFQNKDENKVTEVIVESVTPSEFWGLVSLQGFVFKENIKQVILPNEDEARRKFKNVERLHIPYHNLICIEEFREEKADLKNLPFLKGIDTP